MKLSEKKQNHPPNKKMASSGKYEQGFLKEMMSGGQIGTS